ncbi:DUF2232 domain-containing protein [Magnetospirillum sp. UT-4]|uniref:DUF2232 domain-containing protein n=1 Tax=Magnetospirillum sp. UT-4 TaxID=2681467 RepID=UPI00137D110B|nr:DUF2232 domain-containing protein [Magnetospirillum sp. UT-4]CAA7626096.1 conserved membrane hypothetical protein [Magnetospirillum sp. UT-4]
MVRDLGLALAAGLLSAVLFLSLAKGLAAGILLSYVAPLPLLMTGLALGSAAAFAAVAAGAAAVVAAADIASLLPFAVVAGLPALVVSSRALLWREAADGSREWYPPGLVLAWLAALGALLVVAGAILVPSHPEGVRGWIADTVGRMLEAFAPDVPAEARRQAVEWWTPLFPAMVVSSWLAMAVINAAAAQGLLVRLGRNRRPSPAYRQLWLPDWLAVLAAAAGMVSFAGGDAGYVAQSVFVVTLVPFGFLGLAAIHGWTAGRANARLILAAVYAILVLAFGWAALAVVGLGLARYVTTRFRRPDSGGGMEG